MNNEQKQIQIKVSDTQKPYFANSTQINVTNEDVILQFAFIRPNTSEGIMLSEIMLTPQHAIRFQKALDETIKKHFTKNLPR